MAGLEETFEAVKLLVTVDTQDAETRAKALAKSILEISKITNTTAKEAGQMAGIWLKSFAELDASTKLILKSAQEYAVTLERIDRSIKGGTQRAAINQVKESEKWLELRKAKELEVSERIKLAEEQAAVLTQEKKLGLENAEAQALRAQLVELEKIAALDAQALQSAQQQVRTEAVVGSGPQARLAIQKLREAESGLYDTSKPLTEQQKKLAQELKNLEPVTNKAGKGLWSLTNFARTALGTLEAMAIFLVTKFIGDAVRKSIDGIKQLELAVYNLAVAEKTLSNAGIDITPQDFQQIIQSVKDLNLAISDTDITKGVADLATGLQDLGLSKEQLEGLSKAAAIIAMAENTTMEDVVGQFAQGIAKGGRGLADLDIQVDADVIKQKALESQLVANEEAWNNLTAAQKQSIETQALYLIILDSANTKLEEMGILNDSVTQSTKEASAEWENLTTLLGSTFKPAIVSASELLVSFLQFLQKSVAGLGIIFATAIAGISALNVVLVQMLDGSISSMKGAIDLYKQAFKIGQDAMLANMFPTGIPGLGTDTLFAPDTPTSPKDNTAIENQEDLQKALEKMNNEILEAQIKLAQDMEEAAIDLGRKLEDIAIEYAKKRADAERDHATTVRDINTSYAQKVNEIRADEAEASAKARNDELEREAEFQNKMLELKENYLMDLEEALHERDARQILRLMKQYNLDKTQAERDHALDNQKAQRDVAEKKREFARRRQEAEAERKAKLAEANQDLKDKLAKLQADEEAERRAANLAYERKMQDLQREMHNRLALVAASLVQEFNLTKQGLDAIYKLYTSYYGAIAQVYAAMNTMLGGGMLGAQSAVAAKASASNAKAVAQGNRPAIVGSQRYAEGGMMIADKPTTVTFGEGDGLEMATFTPLNKTGRDVNKLFTNLSGQGGSGSDGILEVDVTLSPDLEARIVRRSMDETAGIITKVKNSKRR